jgi:hypothetical protein
MGGEPSGQRGVPWWKYDANIFLTSLANIVFRRYLTEIHSGFRAYSQKYLETVRFEQNNDDFIFDTQIIAQGMACNLIASSAHHFCRLQIIACFHSSLLVSEY